MTKFATRLLIFVSLMTLIALLGMVIPLFTPHQNLHYALIDKHDRLQKINSPRIVLIGGSNLSFGVDSRMIEDAFGIPVINTSIHAGMGLDYIIKDIIPYIKENDIVILAPEYDHFYGKAVWGYEPMISSVFAIPSNWNLLNLKNWREMISTVPKQAFRNILKFVVNVTKKITGNSSPGIYDRDSFNENGDVIVHYNLPAEGFTTNDIDADFHSYSIELIAHLRSVLEKKNARLFITYPCLNQSSFDIYPTKIGKIKVAFEAENFAVLGEPADYSFNDSLYFNAKYHLTRSGVVKRTSILIDDLRLVYNSKK